MKSFIVLLCLVVSSFAFKETLMTVLKSPTNTLRLYRNFKSRQHLKFEDSKEDRRRFRKFKRSAKMVANANEHSDSAVFALNLFSTMSRAEKKQYLGLNITGHEQPHSTRFVSSGEVPAEKLWTNEGAVTEVVNQGTCGSCWTFGAVGGVETRYKNLSGKLRRFSEQEYLDCVYEQPQNGCNGGWPSDSYTYSKKNGGRLASAADYPYTGSVGTCQKLSKPDAAVAYKITGSYEVGPTEAENIQALADKGSLTVAFEVTDYFQQYSSGILKDTTCTGSINHAVVAVGYTADYVLVKNSWGRDWGDQGFVRFARNHHNCELFKFSYYPTFEVDKDGATDNNPSDAAVSYTPTEGSDSEGGSDCNPAPDTDCKDEAVDCDSWMCEFSSLTDMMKEWCKKTCSHCSSSGGSCPCGTTLCSDNVCRHSHMC